MESKAPRISTNVATKKILRIKGVVNILPIKVERHSIVPMPFRVIHEVYKSYENTFYLFIIELVRHRTLPKVSCYRKYV